MALSGFDEGELISPPEVGPDITPDWLPALLLGLIGSPEILLGLGCALSSGIIDPAMADPRDIINEGGGPIPDSPPTDGFLFFAEGD